jgi:hypothetical protein
MPLIAAMQAAIIDTFPVSFDGEIAIEQLRFSPKFAQGI